MECLIHGKTYLYCVDIREDKVLRRSFNDLAEKTFELNFEDWYGNGYWGTRYQPHVLLADGRVVANVSVNVMDFNRNGRARRAIQLGTVMTDEKYRNGGLSRFLMGRVLEHWTDRCEAIYLFANDSVLDFYPRFGFAEACEFGYARAAGNRGAGVDIRRLDMRDQGDIDLLLAKYRQSNSFSALTMEDNVGLLMFYCGNLLKDCVYYAEKLDTVIIATREEGTLLCWEILGNSGGIPDRLLDQLAGEGTEKIALGFTPKPERWPGFSKRWTSAVHKEEDTTLFVLLDKDDLFEGARMMFPLLSHA